MKAVILEKPAPLESHPLRVIDAPMPRPGRGELLVRVTACGVCRSNLHMIEGDWVTAGVPAKLPIIPGHEIVGQVADVGEGVTAFAVGARVGLQPLWSSCGRCRYCLTGREPLCRDKQITGETRDGGYAEYVLANEAHTYAVPGALDDVEAAPLFCPGVTAWSAVQKARLQPGQRVAVFGIGGVGHLALELARLTGAETIAVSRGRRHLAVAERLGARPLDASKGDPAGVLAREGGVDASIVFAPSSAVARQAIAATRPGGIIVIGVNADLGAVPFVDEKEIVGSLIGSRQQMREVLALAAAGKVKAVCEPFPLTQAEAALGALARGDLEARAVLVI
ncbi:MAG TPA: alcohol dehydrogenase catalytic domain-containing protein [Polyangia bacterium]|nr:alcohol dehydrogenase catalytic domain-containing protein [Polyangia bacterium]